ATYYAEAIRLLHPCREKLSACQKLGTFYSQHDDFEKALNVYQIGLHDADENAISDRLSFSWLKGYTLGKLGRTKEAEDCFKSTIKYGRAKLADQHCLDMGCVYFRYGSFLNDQKRYSEAMSFLKQALIEFDAAQPFRNCADAVGASWILFDLYQNLHQ